MSVKYLFIDMNSYFASVEQQLDPKLRGLPVVVAPVDVPTTCCLAASYEAKKYGIKTGMGIREAKDRCPGLIVREGRGQQYVEMHHKIVDAVDSVLPVSTILGVDEMACRLLGDHLHLHRALRVANEVKRAIYASAGEYMRCSIGLAPNRLLAKVAADMQKPDGLTILQQEDLPKKLLSLELIDFPGIGPRMERRLNLAGIYTVAQFMELSAKQIGRIWGSKFLGEVWYYRLRGVDVPDTPTRTRSLGHSRVLEPALRNPRDSRAMLIRLIHKAAARLRHIGYFARTVQLSISYLNRAKWKSFKKIEECQDTLTFIQWLTAMWDERPVGQILKLGIVLGELIHENNRTPSLFNTDDKLLRVSQVMDKVNQKNGRYAVYYGGMHGMAESVSTRIAFGVIPDLELTDC
jgi:DNA polymerase-4